MNDDRGKLRLAEMLERETRRPNTAGQVVRYREILADHPEAVVILCADENTGKRFGKAACRMDRCRKIGGARQPRWYQAWASWAERDTKTA